MVGTHKSDITMAQHTQSGSSGHRQRLRARFLAGEASAHSEEALLELLLTYAIPQQDVAPLARTLLERFYDLAGVLAAEPSDLLSVTGVKENSTVLLKAVDYIRRSLAGDAVEEPHGKYIANGQLSLFDLADAVPVTRVAPDAPVAPPEPPAPKARATTERRRNPLPIRPRSELFANASLDDAIEQLPHLPDTESLDEVKRFLHGTLHYSSLRTRKRHADYVAQRMFPAGHADHALWLFARRFAGRQELRDACFYRFCGAEPLMFSLTDDLILPAMGAGYLERTQVRDYLTRRNPASKSIDETLSAIAKVFAASGIARSDRTGWHVAYRDILLPSFAFVLHSEFPEPGMYDIGKLEANRAVRALLWSPDRLLPALYELRNQGIISKVSQIDSVRQFTTRMTLDEVVDALTARESRV